MSVIGEEGVAEKARGEGTGRACLLDALGRHDGCYAVSIHDDVIDVSVKRSRDVGKEEEGRRISREGVWRKDVLDEREIRVVYGVTRRREERQSRSVPGVAAAALARQKHQGRGTSGALLKPGSGKWGGGKAPSGN